MVMPAYMRVVVSCERPVGDRDCALLLGDNETTVHGVRRCRGIESVDPRLSYAPNRNDKASGLLVF